MYTYVQSPGTILPDVKKFLLPVFTHDTAGQFDLLGAAEIVKERRDMNEVDSNNNTVVLFNSETHCFFY